MHTVALMGHTGRTGRPALNHLAEAHAAGKIKLIVVHRPSSDTSIVPPGIETRVIDLDKNDEGEIAAAVRGVEIFL